MMRSIVLSMYKGGEEIKFFDQDDKCYISVHALSEHISTNEIPRQDFDMFWNTLQQLAIIEDDLSLASLDYLLCAKNDEVIFRFHDLSIRKDIPKDLRNVVIDIVEKYVPKYRKLIENLRE